MSNKENNINKNEVEANLRKERSFLGHPRAVGLLSFLQMTMSFGTYGMSAVLIYYLYATTPEGLGFTQNNAAQLVSLYSTLSVAAGLIGSYIADRILGPRKALGFSRIVQTIGYIFLAIPGLGAIGYVVSQAFLIFGLMLSGRSLEALVGKMYEKGDGRRDGAFSITYVISNIGAAAPVLSGTIAAISGYHAAFALSAVLSLAGVIAYYAGQKKFFATIGALPDDPIEREKVKPFLFKFIGTLIAVGVILTVLFTSGILTITKFSNIMSTVIIIIALSYLTYIVVSKKTTKKESGHVLSLVPIYICNCFAMLVWYQSTSILAVYAETSVNRNLLGFEITPAAFQTWSSILAVTFGTIVMFMWTKLGTRQPSAPVKVGIGTILWGLGPILMIVPFLIYQPGVKVNPIWLLTFYIIIMIGEAFTSPVGYSSATSVAPKAFATQMVTVWSLTQAVGAGLSTLSVNFYKEGSEAKFFLLIGGVTILSGIIILIFSKRINKGMGFEDVIVGDDTEPDMEDAFQGEV